MFSSKIRSKLSKTRSYYLGYVPREEKKNRLVLYTLLHFQVKVNTFLVRFFFHYQSSIYTYCMCATNGYTRLYTRLRATRVSPRDL